jgi:hypothetical protein
MPTPKQIQRLENEIAEYCLKNGIVLDVEDTDVCQTPKDKADCIGYFDDETKEIHIAKKNKDYLPTLCHEFSHAKQLVEGAEVFKNYKYNGHDCQALIELQKNNKIKVLDVEVFMKAIRIEWDCEKRTIELIRRYNICDSITYIKKANSYLYSYAMLFFFNTHLSNLYSDMTIGIMPAEFKKKPEDYLNYDFCKYLLEQI